MFAAELFERLIRKHPEAVMVRATLEQTLPPSFVDEVFDRTATGQYTRKLLFSTVVHLMSLVVCRVRTALHSAFQEMEGQLSVTVKSVYNKVNGTEPAVAEALLHESALRMAAIVDELEAPLPPLVPGWRTRILDGNHLAATEHRPQALRTIGGGALPGLALVVFDADRGLIVRTLLCEDAYVQERELLARLMEDMEPGELWIADRNFATTMFMLQSHANQCRFLVRRHAVNGKIRETGDWQFQVRGETGEIDERPAVVEDDFGSSLPVRLIRVRLDAPTRDKDKEIELVTDLPKTVSALAIADAYRQRWQIETSFAELDRVFEGEIPSLAQPRAALLAFSLALIAFNTLGVVKAALRKKHGAERIKNELSSFRLGDSVQRAEAALDIFLDDSDWESRYAHMTPRDLAQELLRLADHVNLRKLRKHPRGPKKPAPKRKADKKNPHFSTARVLEDAERNKKNAGGKKKSPRRS